MKRLLRLIAWREGDGAVSLRPGTLLLRYSATLLLCLVLTACGRSGQPAKNVAVLRYPMVEEPPTLDPARVNDVYVAELLQNVYEGLITFDAQNRVVPALAERWEISPDGKTYTFHLRAGAVFHNGRPVTAEDLRFSFERALRPESLSPTAANYLGGIVGAGEVAGGKRKDLPGVRATDDRTLVVTLDRPRGYFLSCLGYPCAWAVCREALSTTGKIPDAKSAVGTGPFRLAEYRTGSQVTLAAHDRYWGGRPKLDRIERPIQVDLNAQHIMYEAGEVDACNNVSLVDYANDRKNPALSRELRLLPQANIQYMVMHQRLQPVFADRRVRRAFAMAIDRERISKMAYHGACPPAYSFVPPGMPGENPNIRRIPYDPAAARKLLAEAGFESGRGFPRLTLEYLQKHPELADMALIIRDGLKQNLGIQIDVREREGGSFFQETTSQRTPFYLIGWIADYLDPQNYLSTLLRSGAPLNRVAYSNPQFDRLCDRADGLSDVTKRIPLYQQADQIAMDDAAVLPLVFFQQPQLVKPYVKNLDSNLMMPMLPHKRTEVVR